MGDFIDGLGPAQIVGRQVLASPSMGDIQLGLFDRKGVLEVEVIRAKGLLPKPGSKILPGMLVARDDFKFSCRPGNHPLPLLDRKSGNSGKMTKF